MTIKPEIIAARTLELIVLLTALVLIKMLLTYVAPFGLYLDERLIRIVSFLPWMVGNTAFAFIIYRKLRRHQSALSIGVLSVFAPISASLFYLLTISFTNANGDNSIKTN